MNLQPDRKSEKGGKNFMYAYVDRPALVNRTLISNANSIVDTYRLDKRSCVEIVDEIFAMYCFRGVICFDSGLSGLTRAPGFLDHMITSNTEDSHKGHDIAAWALRNDCPTFESTLTSDDFALLS